ncbi:hypothetical protein HMPREF9628_00299 [Peptoanaerobacter stomatis]|uniref:Uncharacterized protein n=1 Tax=Peptoanaerobacter stomatis TaxID=796937 RepID=G9XD60_9FIRM|nr:WYL domain-containing protein [Peptoanaerobacter stomatis]EHL19065.1 hypothetical protein HMPREF9628_00299 [Peptoanaerobacter stomatis]
MELFNKMQNVHYRVLYKMINDIIAYDSIKENNKNIMIDMLRNRQSYEPDFEFEKELLEIEESESKNYEKEKHEYPYIKLFKKDKNNKYSLTVDSSMPIILSKLELQWLKMMLLDDRIYSHLDDELINKLKYKLEKIDFDVDSDFWIKKNVDDYNADKDESFRLKGVIELIKKCISEKKYIVYDSKTGKGNEYKDKIAFPYRIEYSVRNQSYKLISLIYDDKYNENRIIKISLKNITIVKVIDDKVCKYAEYIDKIKEYIPKINEFYEKKKHINDPIELEIIDEKNTLDRCFHIFSYHDKQAYYDSKNNIHNLKIFYYDFDKEEIIKDILSLGSCVIVKKPEEIKNTVIERIKKSYLSYSEDK